MAGATEEVTDTVQEAVDSGDFSLQESIEELTDRLTVLEEELIPNEESDKTRYYPADAFGLLEADGIQGSNALTYPYPCLKTTLLDIEGEEHYRYLLAPAGNGSEAAAFLDLIRQTTETDVYDTETAYSEVGKEWGTGTADVLKAVLDESDLEISWTQINHVSGDPSDPTSLDLEAYVYTEGHDQPVRTDLWTGVLLSLLDDASIEAPDTVWTDEESLRGSLNLAVDFQNYMFHDTDQSSYEPREVSLPEGRIDAAYEAHVNGSINLRSTNLNAFNTLPYPISAPQEYTQILLQTEENAGTIPVSKNVLTEYARKDYKQRTGQAPTLIDDAYMDSTKDAEWPDFIRSFLDDEGREHLIELEHVGYTQTGDTDEPAAYNVFNPTAHYLEINGTTYRVPVHDVQSIIPAITESFQIVDETEDNRHYSPMYQ